ncbi:KGGVGR-motif variant AAA ATPase [Halomonas piscis]
MVDLDLEAPGLGSHILHPDMRPEFGVLDWLVEDLVGNASAALPAEMVAESLLIDSPGLSVAPAIGRRSGEYSQGVLAKLARGYLEGEDGSGFAQRLQRMIASLEAEVEPDVVLIDSRAGLHETVAANLLHLGAEVFFFAVDVPATWEGYRYLLAHLAQLATVGEFENLEADWRQRFHMVHARSSLRDEGRRAFAANAYAVWVDTLYDAVSPHDEEADEVSDELLRFTFDEADPAAPHWPH